MRDLDRYCGCLIGGAAGDALGYAVEFMDAQAIFRRYGAGGITDYALVNGVAEISDDTQMTLFTANGLLNAAERGMEGDYAACLEAAYRDWYATQTRRYPLPSASTATWLASVPGLFRRRAPGSTCMSALSRATCGSIAHPINDSKGCGGVMRVAPIGLYFDVPTDRQDEADRIGAQAAALTHGHELAYMPAAGLVHIVGRLAHDPAVSVMGAVLEMKAAVGRQFAQARHLPDFLALIDRAVALAQSASDDLAAIQQLGEGWTGDEALAIAVYCALKYAGDFERAIAAAVNHGGDSDSTGAIAGNILGAHLGLKRIPSKYLEKLELKEIILRLAEALYQV